MRALESRDHRADSARGHCLSCRIAPSTYRYVSLLIVPYRCQVRAPKSRDHRADSARGQRHCVHPRVLGRQRRHGHITPYPHSLPLTLLLPLKSSGSTTTTWAPLTRAHCFLSLRVVTCRYLLRWLPCTSASSRIVARGCCPLARRTVSDRWLPLPCQVALYKSKLAHRYQFHQLCRTGCMLRPNT